MSKRISRKKLEEVIKDHLSLKENKEQTVLYDIADDISVKGKKNYTLNHLIERVKIYNEENFTYEIRKVYLK